MATAQQTASTTITGVDMAAYFVSDPARAIAWYRDKLGLVPTEIDEQGRGAEFTLPDGSTFGVWNGGDGDPTSGGAVMFAVADAAATVAQLRSRGVEISDPMESPVCKMAFGHDPDGNAYIIHQRTVLD